MSKSLSYKRDPCDAFMIPQGPELQPYGYLTHTSCVDSQSQHFRTRYASPKVIGGRFGAHTPFEILSASRGERQLLRLLRIERSGRLKSCHGTLLRLLRIGPPRPQLLRIGSHHGLGPRIEDRALCQDRLGPRIEDQAISRDPGA